jgi:hypothetical protein
MKQIISRDPIKSYTGTRMYRRIRAKEIARFWFYISEELASIYFYRYETIEDYGKEIISEIENGKINNCIVYYHNTSRGYILSHPEEKFTLSFRHPKPELNLPSYVLIAKL